MKKRYLLSLDQDVIDGIKEDFRILRLPPATLSNIINEQMTAFAPIVHKMAEKKRKGEQVTFEEIAEMAIEVMSKE